MSTVSTHVLDLVRGAPAAGVEVTLEREDGGAFAPVTAGRTDGDGRIRELVPPGAGGPGRYRITFGTGAYFAALGAPTFYPWVVVVFDVVGDGHHHVPLLLGPYGYSTYRGS